MTTLLCLAALALVAPRPTQAAPTPPAERARIELTRMRARDGGLGSAVSVSVGDAPFTRYCHTDTEKPYLHPLIGPSGVPMTREYPMGTRAGEAQDHPHHRALWFAHGDVNGHDFWHGANARIVLDGEPELVAGERGVLRVKHRWLSDAGALVCTEDRVMTFGAADGERTIDFELTLKPAGAPLVFGDTKEGTLAVRLRAELQLEGEVAAGHMRNSAGFEDDGCWGKRAAWTTTWGTVDGELVGLTIFDHPENHAHPTWWHARDYGLFAANPFGKHDFEGGAPDAGELVVPADGSVTFRYRLVLYAGAPGFERIQAAYERWAGEAR